MTEDLRDKSIGVQVLYASRLIRRGFDLRAKRLGLTRAQWQAVIAIHRNPGLTQRHLAAAMEIGEVAAGQLVERLQKDGWVKRERDPNDRRSMRLIVDPSADTMMRDLIAFGREEEEIFLAGLDERQKAGLSQALDVMTTNLLRSLDSASHAQAIEEHCGAPAKSGKPRSLP